MLLLTVKVYTHKVHFENISNVLLLTFLTIKILLLILFIDCTSIDLVYLNSKTIFVLCVLVPKMNALYFYIYIVKQIQKHFLKCAVLFLILSFLEIGLKLF